MYLKNGKVNGQQIVSESWINRSTERRVSTKTGEYGYQWWRFKKSSGEKYSEIINTSYFAVGIGNQTIFVIPEANMAVVSTADNLLHEGKNIFNLFFEQIIPALKFGEGSNK